MPKPLADTVLIEVQQLKETSSGGIILSSKDLQREQAGSEIGIIKALGELAFEKLEVIPKVGDRVFFPRYAGRSISPPNGRDIRLIYDTDIYGIAEEGDIDDSRFE